jgi:hypothetical protein
MNILRKIRELYLTRKIGKAIEAGAVLATAGSIDALAQEEFKQEPKIELHGSAGVRIASAHIVDSGVQIGKGPVQQDHVSATADYKGFGLTGLIWHDFSLKTKTFDENDYWLILDIPALLKDHGINISARYQRFIYPSHPEWGQDNLGVGVISYNGFVNAKLEWHHLFPQGSTEEGDRLTLALSKPVIVYEVDDLSVKLNPSISSAYDSHFFGRDGLMHITPGIAVQLKKGKYSLAADFKTQKALEEPVKDMVYGGLSAGIDF